MLAGGDATGRLGALLGVIAYRSASKVLPIRSVEAVEAEGLYALGSYGPAVTMGGAFGPAASEAAPGATLDIAVGGIEAALEFGIDTSLSASEFSVGYVGEGVLATAVGDVTGIGTEGEAAARVVGTGLLPGTPATGVVVARLVAGSVVPAMATA